MALTLSLTRGQILQRFHVRASEQGAQAKPQCAEVNITLGTILILHRTGSGERPRKANWLSQGLPQPVPSPQPETPFAFSLKAE